MNMNHRALAQKAKVTEVLFRQLLEEIPSTTYGTFSLYRYPAKFIPQVIGYVLKTYAQHNMCVFDPFAGYGTVGVVSRIYGHDYELWDLNPLLELLHAASTMAPAEVNVEDVLFQMARCEKRFSPQWSHLSYWFPEKFLPLLSKAWGFYHSLENTPLKLHLIIPLLNVTRYFSYDDMQRQKLSKSPKSEARVNSLLTRDWENAFYRMLAEEIYRIIQGVQQYWKLSPKRVAYSIRAGIDALSTSLNTEKDILITSPPYLQAQEYIRQAKLDLFWLGYSEDKVRQLSRLEIPYREVAPCPINSETYLQCRQRIQELHLRKLFDRYFWGVLGALSRLQEMICSYLFLFVGPATVRGQPIPIDRIFSEHFESIGWKHEATLRDSIISRRMFFYGNNPATGMSDVRMRNENLVILKRMLRP